MGCSPSDRKELDMTEKLHFSLPSEPWAGLITPFHKPNFPQIPMSWLPLRLDPLRGGGLSPSGTLTGH